MAMLLNNGICRCCSSEGTFKDVKTKYHWMGEEEVYADMLKDCFDISLKMKENCEDSGICEVCITQLRNAANFKKQVLHTEQQFLKLITKKTVEVPVIEAQIKIEGPKDEEMEDLSDHFADGDDLADPDFLPELKEETIEEPKPKKRVIKAIASSSRAKKPAAIKKTAAKRPGTSGFTIKSQLGKEITTDKKTLKSGETELQDFEKNKRNLINILSYSNASPIAHKGDDGYSCSACPKSFQEPAKLKNHYLKEHKSEQLPLTRMLRKLSDRAIKLDVTKLRCSLCNRNLKGLEDLIRHLKNKHNKDVYMDVKSHLLPLKFDSPVLRCAICLQEYSNFKHLIEHMNVHYSNYVCETCNSSFVTDTLLRSHVRRHETGTYECELCEKIFHSDAKRKDHLKRTHLGFGKRHACKFCDKRFVNYYSKTSHMVKEHGAAPVVLNCNACERTFNNMNDLTLHTKKDHLMERKYECSECEMKFFNKTSLKNHILKHTGERKFRCDICFKTYGRPYTLKEHMRIHKNDRRFTCSHCGEAFIQKSSWKSHMRSKHGEIE